MCDCSNPTSKKGPVEGRLRIKVGGLLCEPERGTTPSLFPCVFLFDDHRLGIRNRLQLSIPPEASGRVSILAWDDGKWN